MSLRGIRAAVAAATVAVLAAVTLTAGPAAAASISTIKTGSDMPVHLVQVGTLSNGEPVCTIDDLYGTDYGGQILCRYNIAGYSFAWGSLQIFAIGTNYAVYTRWISGNAPGISPWVDLGGQVKRATSLTDPAYSSPWVTGTGNTPTLGVYGNRADYVYYTRSRSEAGTWSPWKIG